MAKAQVQRRVQCYHCRHCFDVASITKSTVCPSCNKALIIEDIIVRTVKAVRKVQTCGKVIVHKNGRVVATLVEALGGLDVNGHMEAKVLSGGPVHLGKFATWRGDCSAPSLSAELGCQITLSHFAIGATPPP